MLLGNLDAAVKIANRVLTDPTPDTTFIARIAESRRAAQTEFLTTPTAKGARTAQYAVLDEGSPGALAAMDDPTRFDAVMANDIRVWHVRTFVTTGMRVYVAGALGVAQAAHQVDALVAGLAGAGRSRPPRPQWNTASVRSCCICRTRQ